MHCEGLGAVADRGQQNRLEANEQDKRQARRDFGAGRTAADRRGWRDGGGPSASRGGRRREESQATR